MGVRIQICRFSQLILDNRIKQGWNELMMKITNVGGPWGVCARFRAFDGSKLDGLKVEVLE